VNPVVEKAGVVVITGAVSGIGLAAARLYTERGHRVVAVDRDEDGLAKLAADGHAAATVAGDVAVDVVNRSAARLAVERFGRLNAAVLNAGIGGDRVVLYWRMAGIHRGTILGVPGSGRAFAGDSISTLTLRNGGIVRYPVLPAAPDLAAGWHVTSTPCPPWRPGGTEPSPDRPTWDQPHEPYRRVGYQPATR
jgi:hypothetical protein